MYPFHIKLALIVLVACWFMPLAAVAQTPDIPNSLVINGDNNESTKAELDVVAHAASDDKLIIVIARLGSDETARRLSQRRLQTVRWYLESVRAIQKERIVTAEGESVRGRGRVEIYLDGKLFRVFYINRNKNFAKEQ